MSQLSHGGDLEWALHKEGAVTISLPRRIAVRNCGYVPPEQTPHGKEAAIADHR